MLANQIRQYRAAHARGHAIVAGDDDSIALTLARNLGKDTDNGRGRGRTVVIVSTSDNLLAQARQHDILTVPGDPSDEATLSAAGVVRAGALYACAGRGAANAGIAVLAGQLTEGRKRPLSAYALVPDIELGVDLRALRLGVSGQPGLDLAFFSLEDAAARKLLADYLPTADVGQPPRIVIIGFGPLGQAVLRETAWRRLKQMKQDGGPRAEVFLPNVAEDDVRPVAAAFPAIDYACSVVYGAGLWPPRTADYTVFVCPDSVRSDDDDKTLHESMSVRRAVASGRGRVVACAREPASFARTLAGYTRFLEDLQGRISVFGILEEACMPANIRDDAFIEQIAEAIHKDYVANAEARGETEKTNSSMVPWNRLPDDLRQANIAQAVNIGVKLETINAVVAPESLSVPEFSFTKNEVEDLAKLEHERWRQERTAQGWRPGEKRDNKRKIHPSLVDWAVLPESEREKDRASVLAMPGVLHEAGYQILRVPPDP